MYTKKITFDDLEGNPVTDEFHFHLSKPQMARLEVSKKGGLDKWVKEIMDRGDSDLILETFEKLISMSYGLKAEDGRRFIQSDALSESFMQTDAYSQFFAMLLSDVQEAALFITNIVPKDMRDRVPNLETTEEEEKRILDVPVESLSPQIQPPNPNHYAKVPVSASTFGNTIVEPPDLSAIMKAISDGKITLNDATSLSPEDLAAKIRG